jgi:hypothetical protein
MDKAGSRSGVDPEAFAVAARTARMVTDAILSDPRLYGALLVALALALVAQQYLGWRRYAQLHALRRLVFPILHGWRGLFLVSDKGYRSDAEYLGTYDASVKQTWMKLVGRHPQLRKDAQGDGSPHLISSVKRRTLPDGSTQLSAAHVVWSHSDGSQTEAYLFVAPDGGTDVYAHHEPGVLDAKDHLSGEQADGDPRGVVRGAFSPGTLERRDSGAESGTED